MVNKQTEGDNQQRRAAAKDARRAGQEPSAAGVTAGASKQRRHLRGDTPHDERVESLTKGKLPSSPGGKPPNTGPRGGSEAASKTNR